VLNGLKIDSKENPSDSEVLVHDAKATDPTLAFALSRLSHPDHPVPVGVFRDVERPLFHEAAHAQVKAARAKAEPDLGKLFNSGSTWTV
ncbi:MAG TPA: 2-oxoacid:ferredoxin oxidoreductase subunit beta, partial [Fibrobacteria bacterium]|nr:2-oxoacid:ferredoxin oxidoreductase subunit beta [Fibrobacteria bacterium]